MFLLRATPETQQEFNLLVRDMIIAHSDKIVSLEEGFKFLCVIVIIELIVIGYLLIKVTK